MSIGTTIVYSTPVVGTTSGTLSLANTGVYQEVQETGDVDVPIRLTLRASDGVGTRRSFGATWKFDPSSTDAPGSQSKGGLTVSLNVNARLGSVMTSSETCEEIRQFMAAMLKSGLLEDLLAGSVV
jgi:hypothetical protein